MHTSVTLKQIQHIVPPVHSAARRYCKYTAEQFLSHGQSGDTRRTRDVIEVREYSTAARRPHSAETGQKSEGKLAVSVLLFTEKPSFPLLSKC